jgi:hypothetical protein
MLAPSFSMPSSAIFPLILPSDAKLCPDLPYLEVFEGAKSMWRGWKLKMKSKLTIDAVFISNAYAQISYVYSRFNGKIRENVIIFVENAFTRNDVESDHLFTRFDMLYGEKDRK